MSIMHDIGISVISLLRVQMSASKAFLYIRKQGYYFKRAAFLADVINNLALIAGQYFCYLEQVQVL